MFIKLMLMYRKPHTFIDASNSKWVSKNVTSQLQVKLRIAREREGEERRSDMLHGDWDAIRTLSVHRDRKLLSHKWREILGNLTQTLL